MEIIAGLQPLGKDLSLSPSPLAWWYEVAKITGMRQMAQLTVDLEQSGARPYFLWDEEMTIDEFRRRLAGHRIEDALEDALRKDGGCTPATPAWALSQIEIPDRAELPGGIPVDDMRNYAGKLISRLLRSARPEEK